MSKLTDFELHALYSKVFSDKSAEGIVTACVAALRAIEAAATEQLLQRIAELEQRIEVGKNIVRNDMHRIGQLQARVTELERQLEEARKDVLRLNWIALEYAQVDTFAMPSGADDADVGWTIKQWHIGESVPRLLYRHHEDDLRTAIDAAMQKGQS